jgi:hypothetical protein
MDEADLAALGFDTIDVFAPLPQQVEQWDTDAIDDGQSNEGGKAGEQRFFIHGAMIARIFALHKKVFVEAGDTFQFVEAGIGFETIGSVGDNDDVIHAVSFGGVDTVEADGIVLDLLPMEEQWDAEDGACDGDTDGVDIGGFEVEGDVTLCGATLELRP